jgi:hypothetical protein
LPLALTVASTPAVSVRGCVSEFVPSVTETTSEEFPGTALLSLNTIDPLLPVPGDCTCAVTPDGRAFTLAVNDPFDPDRLTAIVIAAVLCPGNEVTVELLSTKENCGPLLPMPPELPHPAAIGSARSITPSLPIPVITTRKPTTANDGELHFSGFPHDRRFSFARSPL